MRSLETARSAARPRTNGERAAAEVLDCARFFLRRPDSALPSKYFVYGEGERKLLFVEHARHHAQNLRCWLGAAAGFVVSGLLALGAFTMLFSLLDLAHAAGGVVPYMAVLAGAGGAFATGVALSPRRHVSFYGDESKRELVLQLEQDRKFELFTASYTVKDPSGTVLAHLATNHVLGALRKYWTCRSREEELVCTVREESLARSLRQRLQSPLGVRSDFVFLHGASEGEIGRLDRQLTLFDSYVLDLGQDVLGILDRRVAVAIGILLDTGAKR